MGGLNNSCSTLGTPLFFIFFVGLGLDDSCSPFVNPLFPIFVVMDVGLNVSCSTLGTPLFPIFVVGLGVNDTCSPFPDDFSVVTSYEFPSGGSRILGRPKPTYTHLLFLDGPTNLHHNGRPLQEPQFSDDTQSLCTLHISRCSLYRIFACSKDCIHVNVFFTRT